MRGPAKQWPSRPLMRDFVNQMTGQGFATYQSALDRNGKPELTFPEMVLFTRNLMLSTKRPLIRHNFTQYGTRLYQDNGEYAPVVFGPTLYPHQDYPSRKRPTVMGFVNQQRHGNHFRSGGERQLVLLENPEVQAYLRRQNTTSAPLKNLPQHLIHQLEVPEGVPHTAIVNDARVAHGAKPIELDETHPWQPSQEGRQQAILEFH
jgi:hypothetical protein